MNDIIFVTFLYERFIIEEMDEIHISNLHIFFSKFDLERITFLDFLTMENISNIR